VIPLFRFSGISSQYKYVQVKENEMSKGCSTNGGEEECILDIAGKARKKEATRVTKT
jgi:hypothetical protein